MSKFKQADLKNVTTIPLKSRKSKVRLSDFAKVYNPKHQPFGDFIRSLPHVLIGEDLRLFVEEIVRARKKKKAVIFMLGAHVVKVGLSPLIIDLLRKNMITAVAVNSAAAIHDVEIARWGRTSEDVEAYITDGRFGMSKETGEFINESLRLGCTESDAGYGETIGASLRQAPYKKASILATCYTLGIPATVHAAIGTDIIHQQPSMDGGITGEMSFRDFKVLCEAVRGINNGGIVVNVGSAVILPEVFLKALTVARNLYKSVKGFTTANFDMIQHYRPRMNVVHRPTRDGGKGYLFTGHHEIMIPLLCAMINNLLKAR